jgi:hypothetical protein
VTDPSRAKFSFSDQRSGVDPAWFGSVGFLHQSKKMI